MSPGRPVVRLFVAPPREVVRATDLSGVGVLKEGNLYLLTDPFGDIHPDSRGLGLYAGDTRILSCLVLTVDGLRPVLLRGDTDENYRGTIQLTNPDLRRNPGDKIAAGPALARQSLGIARQRVVGDAFRERLVISNFTDRLELLTVELALGVDCADIFEVRGYPRTSVGTMLPIAVQDSRAAFGMIGRDGLRRQTQVAFSGADVRAADDTSLAHLVPGAGIVLRWTPEVAPGGSVSFEWTVWAQELAVDPAPADQGQAEATIDPATPPPVVEADGRVAYRTWRDDMAAIGSDNELFDRLIGRSVADLRLLRNDGPAANEHYLAAGVPWFSTLFGRDSLISAFQAVAFRPQLAVAVLHVLAARQATLDDPNTDAEPGKILHELRSGEMVRSGELPFATYFGSVDATPLWLILLCETFDWTGDEALVEELWPHALAALDWIDRATDADGFVAYQRRSERGLINQGWKDSADSVRDRHGRVVPGPIRLAEVQGYVHDAQRRMARLARRRGALDLAAHLEQQADVLRRRFDERFWVADLDYHAMALGRDGQQADAITSNVGQALWGGIVLPERSAAVVARLTGQGLDSGWGVRTYAAGQPGYNPLGYHTGSVWPHDNSLIVAGLKRYGYDAQAGALAGRIFEAAQQFPDFRLPELYSGFDRRDVDLPVPYPVACSPQAWSAATPLLLVGTMLGMRANATEATLELVRPTLPSWLTKLTVTNLRVGPASVDLLFHRWRGTTSAEVLRKSGHLEVTIRV